MSRRAFVVFFGALLAAPIADRAQPAGTTAAATVLDARPQQIASLRTHCVPLSDPYVADVKRICRVNVFRAMGTVNGKRIYFALYRRLVVLPQDDVPVGADHSQAGSQVDRPPFVNTAVVIFEESEPDKARPILAAANEGYLGNEWFNEPRSIDRDGKHLIVISRMVGSILEEDYYRFQNGAWVTEDATKVKWPFSDYPMIDRPAVVTGLGAVLATPRVVVAQPRENTKRNRNLLSVLAEEDLRAEPFQCDCEFYHGSNAIGNTLFATRHQRSVAFVKIDGTVIRLTAAVRVSDLGCDKARSYREEWRGNGVLVKLQFRAAGTGEEACWYKGRLTVETETASQTVSVSGSCGC